MKEEALFNAWHSNVMIIGTQRNRDFAISVQEIAIFHAAIDSPAGAPGAGPGDPQLAARTSSPPNRLPRARAGGAAHAGRDQAAISPAPAGLAGAGLSRRARREVCGIRRAA